MTIHAVPPSVWLYETLQVKSLPLDFKAETVMRLWRCAYISQGAAGAKTPRQEEARLNLHDAGTCPVDVKFDPRVLTHETWGSS